MSAQPQPAGLGEFGEAVRAGLTAGVQKTLPCHYLYDDVGTLLFRTICLLPEYGLTRTDDRLIRAHARELAARLSPRVTVVELGSGAGSKTGHILEALSQRSRPVYYPVDVSATALEACRHELSAVADVRPLRAAYLEGLRQALIRRQPGQQYLVLFLGSTIGNFSRAEAGRFLATLGVALEAGDVLLVGADLVKPEPVLLEAYDDPTGVTAAFNLNLLARINRELGGDFDLRRFAHEARFHRQERRVEMHLRSLATQRITVREAGLSFEMRAGETIWTESSYKYTTEEIRLMACRAGLDCAEQWVDEEWPFAESLLEVRDNSRP